MTKNSFFSRSNLEIPLLEMLFNNGSIAKKQYGNLITLEILQVLSLFLFQNVFIGLLL